MVTSMVVGGTAARARMEGCGTGLPAHLTLEVHHASAAISPLRRRVLTLRHRDRTWQEAEATCSTVMAADCSMPSRTGRRGTGRAHADFEASSRALLAQMIEARPDAGTSLQARWEAWWARTRR